MTEKELFTMVGIRPEPPAPKKKVRRLKGFPWISVILMAAIVLCCLFAEGIMTKDPGYLDLKNFSAAPNGEFLFGTDTLGRDIFSGIWYGGRISIAIGFLATLISSLINILLSAVLIPQVGMWGSIVADILATIIQIAIVIKLCRGENANYFKYTDFLKSLINLMIAGVI